MLKAIIREKRQKAWKSRRSFAKAMERKRRLEEKLGRLEGKLKPDLDYNENGILIGVHKCRGRHRNEIEFRFEFNRKDAFRGKVSDFGANDLDALIKAIQAAQLYGAGEA